MTGKEAFTIWAPAGALWADWVRPVPFVSMGRFGGAAVIEDVLPTIAYLDEVRQNTALIVDLPGGDSMKEGVALAKMGFRPIPLFNGTNEPEGAMALVDNRPIESALQWGAAELKTITIPPKAPPVFLLDSNRSHQYKMSISLFDNSWDIYHQDMPSAAYFLGHGIDAIIVRGEAVQKDLAKLLYAYQKAGIGIFFTDGYRAPQKIIVKKPLRASP